METEAESIGEICMGSKRVKEFQTGSTAQANIEEEINEYILLSV